MSADSGPGNREVAYRLFAAEFEDSTVSYSESDEERAPNYVVTPTGGRVNRVFLVGVLTEVERVGGEQLRARVVDPTGAFVAYAGQYQPDELAFLDRVDPPAFLAITGKARTFSPEDSDRVYTSVRPESISEVDAETRDRWVVSTAEQTLDRVSTMASALRSGLRGEELRDRLVEAGVDPGLASGTSLAVERYGTTSAYLQALRTTALDAVRVVAGERGEVDRLDLSPAEGGTEDAVLAGLAGLDLGSPGGSGAAADEPEPTATATAGAGSSEPEPDEATGQSGPERAASEQAGAEGEPADAEVDTGVGTKPEPGTGSEPEPVETTAERDSEPDVEPEPERQTTTATTESGTGTGSGASETEPATDTGTEAGGTDAGTAEPSAPAGSEPVEADRSDETDGSPDDDEEFEDFEPGEFELPEEEREEIETEFGTDFETAGEVDPTGEADIGTPDPDPEPEPEGTPAAEEEAAAGASADTEPEPASESTAGSAPATETETEPESPTAETTAQTSTGADATESDPEPEAADDVDEGEAGADAGDVDVDEVTVEVIAELDDGDGADRDAVVSTVAERHGVDPGAVDEAIENAMMGGRAYEPSDGSLKAI